MPRHFNDNLTFLDHLEELRFRLIRCFAALFFGIIVGYVLAPWPIEWLTYPIVRTYDRIADTRTPAQALHIEVTDEGAMRLINPELLVGMEKGTAIEFYAPGGDVPIAVWREKPSAPLLYLRPMDPFVIRLKAAIFLGILLTIPVIVYQLWAFISPGLLAHERKFAGPLILAASLLFPLGAVFAYFLLEVTLRFFAQFITESAVPFNDARAYLGFVITMMLAFGVVFEFPLVIILATRTGLVTVQWLAERRKYIFVLLLILAALVTPSGDPVTLLALSGPLYLLFEGALWVSRVLDRASPRGDESAGEEDPEESEP